MALQMTEENGPVSALAASGVVKVTKSIIRQESANPGAILAYTGKKGQMVVDMSIISAKAAGVRVLSSPPTSAVALRNSDVKCGDGSGTCTAGATVMGCGDTGVCSTDAMCQGSGLGVQCQCPLYWNGDPLYDGCVLPDGLMFTIPSELKLTTIKPAPVSGHFTLLNGGVVLLRWYLNSTTVSRPGNGSVVRYGWRPQTSVKHYSTILPCAYDIINITLRSERMEARPDHNLTFAIGSNTDRDLSLTVQYDVLAAAAPEYTYIHIWNGTYALAGEALTFAIMPVDQDGIVVNNSPGTDDFDVVLAGRRNVTCAVVYTPPTPDMGPYYSVSCPLTELEGGRMHIYASLGGWGLLNSPQAIEVHCPDGFTLSGGICVCKVGTFFKDSSGGREKSCVPCELGTYKDHITANNQGDVCFNCFQVYALSTTTVIGASSIAQCVCNPGWVDPESVGKGPVTMPPG
jgi:hypothetical protein